MDIPLNVDVFGHDGRIGRSTYIIVNPITQTATHLVVRGEAHPKTERLVSVQKIQESDSDMIRLDYTQAQFANLEPFEEVEFLRSHFPHYEAGSFAGTVYAWPYTTRDEVESVRVVHRHVPPNERDIRRGAHVQASKGRIGQVDELVVDKDSFHLTHLVLHEGHLWGKKDIMIPVDAIQEIAEDTIYLNLDKQAVEALPTFPIQRHVQHAA